MLNQWTSAQLMSAGAHSELAAGVRYPHLLRKLCSPDCSLCTWLQAFLISVCLFWGPSQRYWSTSRFLRVMAVTFTALNLRVFFFCCCWIIWFRRSAPFFLNSFSLYLSLQTDNLLIDYQFTFSLIQEDDNHYTAINFMASPEQVQKKKSADFPVFF